MRPLCARGFRRAVRHIAGAALFSLIVLTATSLRGATPELGGNANAREMAALGSQIMRLIKQRDAVLSDAVTTSYLAGLIEQLSGANALTDTVRSVTVFKSLSINAFVLPGGFVGVNAGLLLAAPNESALASVLAHEIAHLSQRHVERMFARQSGASLATIAGIIAGALVVRDNPEAARAAVYSGIAASVQQQLDYSRSNEREADRIGQKLLENAGFRSAGMPEMLQRMSTLSAVNYRGGLEYLQTHPLTANRVGEAWDRAKRTPDTDRTTSENATSFTLVQTRVATLLDQTPTPSQADNYAAALAALSSNPDKSVGLLDTLPDPWKSARYTRLLRARALSASGAEGAADSAFSELKSDYPNDYLTHFIEAQELARQERYDDASAVLARWLRDRDPPNADALRLVAQYHRSAGNDIEAQRWYGEYYAMTGDFGRAAAHFTEALNAVEEGSNRHARISARLEDISALQVPMDTPLN